jgi:ABC-type bacteriocin/lantibiotic exporter with double-glycine peptidase domain
VDKLKKDFGVRALLATITVSMYELIIAAMLILLYLNKLLTFEGALGIAGLSQAPAMLALGFYFASKLNQQNNETTPPAVPKTPPASGSG